MKKATLYQKKIIYHVPILEKIYIYPTFYRGKKKTTPATFFFFFNQIQSLKTAQVLDNFTFKNSNKIC